MYSVIVKCSINAQWVDSDVQTIYIRTDIFTNLFY